MANGKGIHRVILFSEELVKDSVHNLDGTVKVKSVDVFQLLWQPLGLRRSKLSMCISCLVDLSVSSK